MKPPPKNRHKKHKTIATLECRSLFRPEGGDAQLSSTRLDSIHMQGVFAQCQPGRKANASTHTHTHAHNTLSFTPLEATVHDPLGRTLFAYRSNNKELLL